MLSALKFSLAMLASLSLNGTCWEFGIVVNSSVIYYSECFFDCEYVDV